MSVTTIKDAPVKAQVNDMVVVMQERATEAQIQTVIEQLVGMGFDVHRSTGASRTVIGAVGSGSGDPNLVSVQDGVHEVLRISEPYKLASRTFKSENTVVEVGDVRIGGDEVVVMAETSKVLRVAVSNVRMPRSHRMTLGFPALTMYSAAIRSSSIVAPKPRLTITGRATRPTSRRSE